MRLFRDYWQIRILAIMVVCVSMVLLNADGLGQQPQAITVFSEGRKVQDNSGRFIEIKGIQESNRGTKLYNPFMDKDEQREKDTLQKVGKTPKVKVEPRKESAPREKGGSSREKEAVRLCGVIIQNNRKSALIEKQGHQYILAEGEQLDDIKIESIGTTSVYVTISGVRRTLYSGAF
ncbi:MAG: hypothetical protein K6C05_06755 [Anaerovibrio sp.]|uniref:hypothetical protein n=1 Tax=Anaerovibrio sp. TaxID=1872532 RepID=UPI0025CF149E|nr:hypothetical protein [Anaerovibrio sp.]MCR5176539.1 hypothetical protein [Anaerovibrio sp.]